MSYIDKNLLPDERISYRTKKHIIIFLPCLVWTGLVLFFYTSSIPLIKSATILPAIVAAISWGKEILNYLTSDFAVTNKRVMLREGFFIRHTNETRLATVANITVNQSLIGQLLGYGSLVINTFGGENDPFDSIKSPVAFQRQVLIQLDKKR